MTDSEPLGRGAFGLVRRAVWRGKDVAVKLVALEGNALGTVAREFSREVDMMSRIQHDSLVTLYGVTEPSMGIVMEFVPTGDLQHNFHYPDALLDAERRNLNRIEQKIKTLQDLLETDRPDPASLRSESLPIFAQVPEVEWTRGLSEQTRSLLLHELLAARQLADSITPELHGRLLVSDARLSLDLRLRVAHDVCAGLAYLHSCSPMICHNDLRSPNVFLLQIRDPTRPVAKLADYGLCRWYSGPLKMGLEAWKWLAPEVLDHRHASSFTEKADIFSFGIVLWEVLSGAGINLPYAEYQQRFPRHADLISAIRQDGLRPTLPKYCLNLFRSDSRFLPVVSLMSACLRDHPRDRPTAARCLFKLKRLLGMPASRPPSAPAPVEIPQLQVLSVTDLTEIPRRPQWTCQCGQLNSVAERQQCLACDRVRPSGRVNCMCCFDQELWLGRNDGTVVALPTDKGPAALLSFPKEETVLGLASVEGVGLFAASYTTLMHLATRSDQPQFLPLTAELGVVIALLAVKAGVWLVQCCVDLNTSEFVSTVTFYPGLRTANRFTLRGQISATASRRDLVVLVFRAEAVIYRDSTALSTIAFNREGFTPVAAAFHNESLIVAAALSILTFTLSGELLRETACSINVRCLAGPWVGTLGGLYLVKPWLNVAGDGEVSCMVKTNGLLWFAENTMRAVCCYRTARDAEYSSAPTKHKTHPPVVRQHRPALARSAPFGLVLPRLSVFSRSAAADGLPTKKKKKASPKRTSLDSDPTYAAAKATSKPARLRRPKSSPELSPPPEPKSRLHRLHSSAPSAAQSTSRQDALRK